MYLGQVQADGSVKVIQTFTNVDPGDQCPKLKSTVDLIDLLLDIVTTAAILFVVAAGLLIVYGVLKIINFAHGGFLTIGGYAALVVTQLGLSPWLAAPVALVVGHAARGGRRAADRAPALQPSARRDPGHLGARHRRRAAHHPRFGRGTQVRAEPGAGRGAAVRDAAIRCTGCSMLGVALVLGGAMAAVLQGTRLGLSARAVIMNETLAQSLGINSARCVSRPSASAPGWRRWPAR